MFYCIQVSEFRIESESASRKKTRRSSLFRGTTTDPVPIRVPLFDDDVIMMMLRLTSLPLYWYNIQ
jgi:hypothetical protein